jgi:hypothetical protein
VTTCNSCRCGEAGLRGPALSLAHLGFLTLAFWVSPVFAQSARDFITDFDTANRLYEEGRYREAIQAYQTMGTNSDFASVHFNLGNAFYQAGQRGQAIAQYHRARALAPRDRDINANLNYVRNTVKGPTWKPHWTQTLAQKLTPMEWRVATTAAVWLCFLLLALKQLRPAWQGGLRKTILIAAILSVGLLGVTLWNEYDPGSRRFAVVIEPEAVVRLGPFDASPAAMTAQDGAELLVVDEKDEWLQVTADGQASGWIRAVALRLLW